MNTFWISALGLLVIVCTRRTIAQLVSPCPRLFTYEPQKENDRWFGVVTLISESDLKGVWLRVIFDKPSLQLGNWFGQIRTTDNMEYLIHNRNHELKANMPYALRFYIKFNPAEPPPKLVGFRLNAKSVCPEGETTTPPAITGGTELITSAPSETPATPAPTPAATPSPTQGGGTLPGGGWPGHGDSSSDEDDIFQGDFQLINRPHLRPQVQPECGIVVSNNARRKRDAYGMGSHYNPYYRHYHPHPNYDHNHSSVHQSDGSFNLSDWIMGIINRSVTIRQPQLPTRIQPQSPASTHFTPSGDVIAPIEQQPRPLITYGQSTKEGEFPWHAALYHERGADLQYICGASLISAYHVITVAHCVTRRRSASTLNPDSLVVYLGKYYLKKWSNPGIQDSQVQDIIPHPEYDSQTYANDLAILKLLHAARFTDYVRPICMWADGVDLSSVLNKAGTVVGWGFDQTGKVTEQLTQAKMPVVAKETCIYSFPDFFSRFTTSKTFCAGFRNGTSVCNGDSGGGMVFPRATSTPGREQWQLRGLVSISVALQNQFKCDSYHYVVFTDVAKYLDWIQTAMRQ